MSEILQKNLSLNRHVAIFHWAIFGIRMFEILPMSKFCMAIFHRVFTICNLMSWKKQSYNGESTNKWNVIFQLPDPFMYYVRIS